MKLPILVGAAFVVGLGGGTVVGMRKAPAPLPDSVAKPGGNFATQPPAVLKAPGLPDTLKLGSVSGKDSGATTRTDSASALAQAADVKPALDTTGLARTFGQLSAADAAPMAARLSDGELEAVLRKMPVDKSAALIAAMPKLRGQTLSKRLLLPKSGG